ncbi:MAG: lpxB [Francisellaceae bacterium]|nr:lpxB [Francisellaceae bacterium]
MERLSVMGLWEPLKRLPELIKIRKNLIKHFIDNPPDVFIGIDAPDFNLGLEKKLKASHIKTIHYVSPSVWAWRESRIKTIKKAADLMLCLFPFEIDFYKKHQMKAAFVGHPLAKKIPVMIDSLKAKLELGYNIDQRVLVILPGSRDSELNYLLALYLKTAQVIHEKHPDFIFLIPVVSEKHALLVKNLIKALSLNFPIHVSINNIDRVLPASDLVLVTSGTATLEVMLYKKNMVVAYKMHPITYWIAKKLVKTPFIALPNIIANQQIVSEFIQEEANIDNISQTLLKIINSDKDFKDNQFKIFEALHKNLLPKDRVNAAQLLLKFLNISTK